MPDFSGQSIGRYHIIEKLGEGGMAIVYKAYDTRLECDVAVKFIRLERLSPELVEKTLKRFEREAKEVARLTHPNIVKISDFGEYQNIPYMVMEYLPGGTLKQRPNERMPWLEAVKLLIPVADALAYAHQMKVIHRDVKPANILLTESGKPMLTDFGVAKILDLEEGHTLTGTGVGVGTPEYMAPEQWENKVSPQTDIYALGVVLYELITGRKPYSADTPAAVLIKQITEPLPHPRQFAVDLPETAEKVLYKALAKNPADRYTSMNEMAKALEQLTTHTHPQMSEPAMPQIETAARPLDETLDVMIPSGQQWSHPALVQSPASKPFPWKWISIGTGAAFLILLVYLAINSVNSKQPEQIAVMMATEPAASNTANGENLEAGSTISATKINPTSTATKAIPTMTAVPTLGIGSEQVSKKDGMAMVYVPAGSFMMGSDSSDADSDEKPAHGVYLDAYWIDKYEVTNAQYGKCVDAGVCSAPTDKSSYTHTSYYGNPNYADYPVIYVDWYAADQYCQWAGRALPTEAQWEKAARGTDGRIYPWGNETPNKNLANYDYNKGDTTAVGSYPAGVSPYGAYDMAGNVWEWVADWYSETYYSKSPTDNPPGPSGGTYKVVRGGSWIYNGNYLRAADGYYFNPGNRDGNFGFRCATSP